MDDGITIKELTTILTQDSYYRKLQEWPLLNLNDSVKINREVKDVFLIDGRHLRTPRQKFESINRFKNKISEAYPYINELLAEFRDHLVACGGAVTKIFNSVYNSGDIDLFFYDLDTDEANKMRISVIEFIINSFEKYKKDDVETKYYINRNEYVTTLYVTQNEDEDDINRIQYDAITYDDIIKYQFIHRIYPNLSSIIGGFDISVCMVAYDGNNIYATPLGAWSIQNTAIIIDTKRRSTSFEYRLRKYQKYGFRLLFPGLSKNIIDKFVDNEKCIYDDMINKIHEIINSYDYIIDGTIRNLYKTNRLINNFQSEENLLPYFKLYNDSREYDSYHCNRETTARTIVINKPDIYLHAKLFDHDKIEDRFIEKISDYDSLYTHPICLPKINSQQLRSDKLHSVCSIIEISSNNGFNLHDLLIDDVNNPNIMFDDENIKHYKNRTEKVRKLSILTDPHQINNNFYQLSKYFGKLTPEVVKIQHTDEYYKYQDIIIDKMITNAEICKEKLVGIKWITQNPGRQWTSSINPIIADPREWYGKNYIPVVTGIPPEIETTMRLLCLPKTKSVWTIINNDIFNVICLHLFHIYANDAWDYVY
jgi:hypothetical protein